MAEQSTKERLAELESQRIDVDRSGYGTLNYSEGVIVDEQTGMSLGLRGFLDTGDGTFGFGDPRRGERMPNGQEFFYFPFVFLHQLSTAPVARRRPIGYRIERRHLQRVQYAERFIVAALKAYMFALDNLSDPIVELV